jgi:hypothetical protein
VSDHRHAEERSIALHRAVAARLRDDPRLVERARVRVREWHETCSVASAYRVAWDSALRLDPVELCALLVDPGEEATALRQVSPFAGILDARERWRILKGFEIRR